MLVSALVQASEHVIAYAARLEGSGWLDVVEFEVDSAGAVREVL